MRSVRGARSGHHAGHRADAVTRAKIELPSEKTTARRERLPPGGVGGRDVERTRSPVAAVILNLRVQSGASYQQHGKEPTGENVERKAEAGPPHWDTGILNEQVMKEVEDCVSGEAGHNQPQALLEACHCHREESGCDQGLQRPAPAWNSP
jgi:hypothetical protein